MEGEDTGGGGGPNTGKRRRVRTDRTTVAYRQKHGCNSVELWLHLDGTSVPARRNQSYNPDETVVSTGRN